MKAKDTSQSSFSNKQNLYGIEQFMIDPPLSRGMRLVGLNVPTYVALFSFFILRGITFLMRHASYFTSCRMLEALERKLLEPLTIRYLILSIMIEPFFPHPLPCFIPHPLP